MLDGILSVISSIGVVLSLLLIAWQNKQLTRQTEISNDQARISNEVGSITAAHSALALIHPLSWRLVDEPALQPYFTTDAPLPADPHECARVLMIANIFADTIENGLMVCDLRTHMANYQGWPRFAISSMTSSPALRRVVNDHPEYWPRLNRQWREHRREP